MPQIVLICIYKNKGFKIGQLNIQGIQSKLDQIDLMLNSSSNNVQILGLCETKLKSIHPDSYFFIDNYPFFRRDRIISTERSEQGGGIIVYVKDCVKVKRRNELKKSEIECLMLEIFLRNQRVF